MPKGAKVGLAPASSPAPPVEIVVNPEIHPPVSSVPAPPDVPAPPSANSAPAPALAVDPGHPDRPNDQHESANNQTIAAPPPAGAHIEPSNQQTIGPNGNPLLQVGNATLAQARTGQEPTINGPEIHPSELTATPATAAPKPLPAPSQNLDNFVDDDDFDSGLAHLTHPFSSSTPAPPQAPPALAQAPPAPSGSGQHERNPMGDFTGADHGGVVERSASNQPTIGPNPLLQVGNESLAQAPTRVEPTINNGPKIHPSEAAAPAAPTPAASPSTAPAPARPRLPLRGAGFFRKFTGIYLLSRLKPLKPLKHTLRLRHPLTTRTRPTDLSGWGPPSPVGKTMEVPIMPARRSGHSIALMHAPVHQARQTESV